MENGGIVVRFSVEERDISPTTPSSALEPSVRWTPLAISQGAKVAVREAHHTSQYGANVKNIGSHTSILHRLSSCVCGQFYI